MSLNRGMHEQVEVCEILSNEKEKKKSAVTYNTVDESQSHYTE